MTPAHVQQAIYSELDGALSVPVYDYVPQDAAFPYVSIGDDVVNTWNSDTEQGFEVTLNIHVWSRYAGFIEAKNLQNEVFEALQYNDGFEYVPTVREPSLVLDFAGDDYQVTTAVTYASIVNCIFENADVLRDPDGLTSHGVQRFRFIVDNA